MAIGGVGARGTGEALRHRVVALEPDDRHRTRLAIQLGSLAAVTHSTLDEFAAAVPAGEPAVAVFGPSLANETGLAYAQRLGCDRPETGIVLVAEELSTALLQQALRAGVRDVVTLDADQTQMRQAVERVGEAMHSLAARQVGSVPEAEAGRVIVAFSTKGGVGKSVVATGLATCLAARTPGVVVVDADLQFGDVAVLLGIPPRHTTVDVAASIHEADTELIDGLLGTHEGTGLRVLPAPIEPSAAEQITTEEMLGIVRMLRTMFRFVVVDMPPHFDDTVLALIEEADDVLLVASMDIPSIKNLKVGIQTLDLLSLAGPKLRLVLNRANAKVNLDVADVERVLGVPAEYRIPSDIAVPQAVNRGVPVVLDKPRAAASLAIQSLAESFLGGGRSPEDPGDDADRRRWSRKRSDKELRA